MKDPLFILYFSSEISVYLKSVNVMFLQVKRNGIFTSKNIN